MNLNQLIKDTNSLVNNFELLPIYSIEQQTVYENLNGI